MAWIDHAGAIKSGEPQLPISGLRDQRTEPGVTRNASHPVSGVEEGDWNRRRCISTVIHTRDPPFQFRAGNAKESARHLQPDCTRIVFDRPMHAVARQAIPAGQCRDAAVLQAAQAARGGDPERSVLVESKAVDASSAWRGVRFTDLTILEVRDAAIGESKPQSASP